MKLPLNPLEGLSQALQVREEPDRPVLVPGDAVFFAADGIGGDVPLVQPHPNQALEHEAFTGSGNLVTTGWIRSRDDMCLVIAIWGNHAFLLGREGNGWGWIDTQFLVDIVKYSDQLRNEARLRRRYVLGLIK